ncbi:zinc-finger domain-containing protein [Ponticoccus sp. SC2-23]|uniref:zinc-finger domain-containing protein n=1 Tax=Alexandriicola marinus TaxID=2081710 RepID=UPI000FD98988|nr:zinc-finger domain-containing protein [Alexandriicola marinus]MBM1220292.1 zinc-finger domain-containing protein [Ponticoccus sp. SC6-9]MBM1224978.1 zinc-finger domain-containing protein [Ponticoccus sp. SC6-15]MBM1228492.1 zinc-finger domain-containing protein [Ponticoccus sp. SC6-38]MBM1233871.1 zinc-finger domain-containing protein [Ponticoccus sp. SC6-45]MBM1238993.1 zinc-finger domain-containing protein [Ponticoccus sp. SC6-49]MBM1242775.1 zinc-finger domain-containing protein [Pontic
MPLAEVRIAYPAPSEEVVSTWRVSCDGGEGALGHPRVWMSVDPTYGWVDCGYCDKRFIHESVADT